MTAIQGALLSTLVGVPFGIAASFAAWFIVFQCLVPKIKFSDQINELPVYDPQVGVRHRIKFKNVGRRAAIDVSVYSRLRVRCLSRRPEFSKTWTIVTLDSDTMHEPRIPIGANRLVVFNLESTKELTSSKFLVALQGQPLTLKNLLALGEEAEVVVWVLAFDEFSGARKAFKSKAYKLDDIATGEFGGRHGLELLPLAENEVVPEDTITQSTKG